MTHIDRDQVEAQYLRSPFIKEICVLGHDGDAADGHQHLAVVVPNLDVLRERRVANIGDLLRFEMEGQALFLPPDQRAHGFELWFDPLPRTPTGQIDRDEVERRVRAKRQRVEELCRLPEEHLWAGDAHAGSVAAVIRRYARGARVHGEANLELDLGLDSLERVALLTELEQCFGVRIPHERAHQLLTVLQLIDALRDGDASHSAATVSQSWAVLLEQQLPSDSDPALRNLKEQRPIAMAVFFVISRLLRLVFGPSVVHGRHHLPMDGPYILCPNHGCYVDPFIVCGALPYRVFRQLFVVGATEYFETPFMSWLARKINLLPVDPDCNLVAAMQASAFGLQRGKILMLFPEGERSIDGTVKRFKKGAPILAQHLAVPIVPVAIRGAFELWPRNRPINWRAALPLGHRVRVRFGPPMRFEPTAPYGESADRLRDAVEKMWERL